ncbi:MAG: TIGR02147 family protein [Chitinispirillaceae bacterium]|nr:TIGR02147 family protein [Chitinispirillaceae bacterium]
MSIEKPFIFDYMNYRTYLSDTLSFMKEENSAFSMRALAAKIQCNPGFFNRILKGERNLMAAHIVELGRVFKFSRKEVRYFELLVAYNHAKRQSERDYNLEQLLQLKKTRVRQIAADQYKLYSHWYYLVIRELLAIMPRLTTLEAYARLIAKSLEPQVSYGEVRDALDHLLHLGVIRRLPEGALAPADKFTASGTRVPQVIVNRFLLEFADLARRSIDGIPKKERRLSTLTFSTSAEGFEKIASRIDEFRQEILSMVANDADPLDRVCHLNLQLFPVTRYERREEPV